MYATTLCLPVKGEPIAEILLGLKKTGFGRGKYNGFGGKVMPGETFTQAAVRELYEECLLTAAEQELQYAGRLEFLFPFSPALDHDVAIYLLRRWRGEPGETEEMQPAWFPVDGIPYGQMWADDIAWLPSVLRGEVINGQVLFGADNESILEIRL